MLVTFLFSFGAAVLASGCAHESNRTVTVTGVETGPISALVVVNPRGDVRVVSGDLYDQPEVEARVRAPGSVSSSRRRAASAVEIEASVVDSPLGRVLRVEVPEQEGEAGVNLTIRVPEVTGGANIRASRGDVSMTGVSGPIDIVNASDASPAGRVVVRSARGVTGDISIVGHGRGVVLVVPGPVNADVAVYAPGHEAIAEDFAGSGIVRDVTYGGDWYRAKYNDAGHTVVLRALGGNARLLVKAQPEKYWP